MTLRAILAVFFLLSMFGCQKQNAGGSGSGTYQVVVSSYDTDRKITAVKAVRDNAGIGLAEAKALKQDAASTSPATSTTSSPTIEFTGELKSAEIRVELPPGSVVTRGHVPPDLKGSPSTVFRLR